MGDLEGFLTREGANAVYEMVAAHNERKGLTSFDAPPESDLPWSGALPCPPSAFAAAIGKAQGAELEPVDGVRFLSQSIPEPDWIIPDFIAPRYQCALYGKSKSQKTFFALQLGLSVALGERFLGFPAPTRPRRVAYFNLELMPYFMQERMRAQTAALGALPKSGNFLVYNLRGRAGALRDAFTDADGNPVAENALTRQLRSRGVDLAIIDPRYKLMQAGEDENTALGLRALLELRTAFAEVCAVLIVGHDPKGASAGKDKVDRGAGSYTAIADDDATILLSPNETAGNGMNVETVHRNRAPITPFVALFDGQTQTFTYDPHIPVDTPSKPAQSMTAQEKAQRNAETEAGYESAALAVADKAGDKMLGVEAFKSAVAKLPAGAAIGVNASDRLFKALVQRGVLAKVPELERRDDGTIRSKVHGQTFVSTPERIAAYRKSFEG